jgi:acyl-CoA dehydrogenase
MSDFQYLLSPVDFLRRRLPELPMEGELRAYEAWWEDEGSAVSAATDRAGTPWLRMFDRFGRRQDEILFPPEYREMLLRGYREGVVWRAFEGPSLLPSYLLGYLTAFFDPGLYCPYTVSLSTAVPLFKYGSEELQNRFLGPLLRRDDSVWQGATWMTEAKGGSDLGTNVETTARPVGERWLLTGEKYFASNVGAELAVVAARPEGAPEGVRGLDLFLLPKFREDGSRNYLVRRLKDKVGTRSVPTGEVELRESEAWLLGRTEWGIYEILEVLNLSRTANAVASVALAQRALREAFVFAREREAFGRPILDQPLMRRQFEDRAGELNSAFALARETVTLLNEVWRQSPPYSERYHLFRLVAHLAKYHTADFAARTARWTMEVHGGMGVLAEFPAERWFREAMVLAIWEGTSHRQILDGLETMQRKGAHRLLFERLAPMADPKDLVTMREWVEGHLALPAEEQEAEAEGIFAALARFTAEALLRVK